MKYILAILLISSISYADEIPEYKMLRRVKQSCKTECTYRDRKAKYIDQQCVNECVPLAMNIINEAVSRRLRDDANRALIEANETYQNEADDREIYYRNW